MAMSTLLAGAKEALARRDRQDLDEMVEATLGPNPCRQLVLRQKADHTQSIAVVCDRKRCAHCGPRKQMRIRLQMRDGFGASAFITRTERCTQWLTCGMHEEHMDTGAHVHHYRPLKQAIDRAKQWKKAGKISDYTYQVVGDRSQGYLLISDVKMIPEQKRRNLAAWMDRILGLYLSAAERIRRSVSLGITRVSPLSHISRRRSGEESAWEKVNHSQLTDLEAWFMVNWDTFMAFTSMQVPRGRPMGAQA